MNEREQSIMRILDNYKAAVFAKDVDAFIALYDENVDVFDMWGTWAYNGVEAWRGTVADWFGSLTTERVVVGMEDIRTIVAHDVAVVYAFVTYKGLSAEGKELRAMRNRITMVLKHNGDAWKIVHEHSSAPIDGETLKAILQH